MNLFVLQNDGQNLKASTYSTENKMVSTDAAFIIEAPTRHFDTGGDVGFMEFSDFYGMVSLATQDELEKAEMEALKTDEGVAGIAIKSPVMESAMEYRMASMDSLELKQAIYPGLKKDGKIFTKIPESLVKVRFSLTDKDLENIIKYGNVVGNDYKNDVVVLTAKGGKIQFSYVNSITGCKASFKLDAEVVDEVTLSFTLKAIKKLPKTGFNVVVAGNLMTWDQIMPPVGEGEKAVPSDISVRSVMFALSKKQFG